MPTSQRTRETSGLVLAPRSDLCLDFVNTLYWRGSVPRETLHEFTDLLNWGTSAASVLAGGAASRKEWARLAPGDGASLFRDAITLRETLYRIFHATAGGGAAADEDLAALNRALKETPARGSLQRVGAGFGWRVGGTRRAAAAALLSPVLWSAGDLLTGPQLARVRECANDKCLWLFLDESKNGARRWCSMKACGNRAKAHRHYIRHKSG